MYGTSDFHESYYDHRCLIIPQKDVLQIDIPGSGLLVNLKRWWNNLFLLSYSDCQAWVYYSSSRNMHMERFKQYRQYRHRIHPLSKFRNSSVLVRSLESVPGVTIGSPPYHIMGPKFGEKWVHCYTSAYPSGDYRHECITYWDCLMVNVFILHKIVFHHNTSVLFGKVFHMFFYYVASTLEVIIISDLIVNLKTGFISNQNKRIILDTKEGILNYCSTKLFIHFLSAIPLQWIMFLRYKDDIECALSKTNYFVCALRIIDVFSLYRVFETSAYWCRTRIPSKTMYFFKFLRIGLVGFISMLQLYDLSDTICLITTIWTGEVDETAFFNNLVTIKFAIKGAPPNFNLYCFNFARICKSLLLFSFGIRFSKYYLDKMTSLVAYFIANIFYIWCFLECYGLIIRRKYNQDQMIIDKTLALNIVHYRQLPDGLCHKISQYYDFKMSDLKRVEISNELYTGLPNILKREAALHCYSKRVARLPFFSGWPPDLTQQVVLALNQDIYLTGDIVAESWVSGDGLMIVDVGQLAVYSAQEKETGHLIEGDYFSELSLVTDKEVHMSCVVAITPCKVLVLKKTVFRVLMRNHADLFFTLRQQLLHNYRTSKHQHV